ncbi:MAG: tyrosine-type recombinase/integrase [Desulfobacterales bacterium]
MSVHQLKDGRWFVRYPKGTLPDDPDRTREYFGRGLEAERQARRRNEEIGLRPWERRTPEQQSPTFGELAQAYLTAKEGRMSDVSRSNLAYKLNAVILPQIGAVQAIRLTADHLDKYVIHRIGSGIKSTTIHRELSDLQAILNWAASSERRYIAANPVAGYKKPARDDAIIPPPTPAEIRRILEASPHHLVRAISLSYYTGLRPGAVELLSRRWHHVDWDSGTILIESASKGGPRARLVPMRPEFHHALDTWYRMDGKKEGAPIIHWHGKPVSSVKTAWKAAKKTAGIKRRLRLYDCRHAFASELLKGRADLKSTSELLGHSRTETTTRIYQHTTTAMHRTAIEHLPQVLDEALITQKSVTKKHKKKHKKKQTVK